MRFLLITVLMLSITTYAQEENSREFADGVIELTTVKVKTNFLQDYLDGIEKTWVAAAKIQQEMGIISNYNVYVGNDGSTVYLTQTYPSWANKAPWTDEQTAEFQKRFNAEVMSEDDNTALAQSYEDIREIVSVELIGRLIFN
ncbi:MAG: hypothetical protein ACJ0FJ_04480 [Gammaproteobacteria bacterium]|tara:strand:+ start:2043 stop:2471 length:429 start_codon:yes stop_codon:yes gene_type:complete